MIDSAQFNITYTTQCSSCYLGIAHDITTHDALLADFNRRRELRASRGR